MNRVRTPSRLLAARRRERAGFTFVEVMIAACLTLALLVAALSGVVMLQKSYVASENYATGLSDEMRLLDYLALDLRRATSWAPDADLQGLKVTVPDYYSFNSSDPQHLFPVANPPTLDTTTGKIFYASPPASASAAKAAATAATAAFKAIAYRYTNGLITRDDPWAPLVPDGKGGYQSAGPVTIATTMSGFPEIKPDKDIDSTDSILRYKISFYSSYQPFAVQNDADTITLHNLTFVRSKNLSR